MEKDNKKTVLIDNKNSDVSKKEVSFEHASNIFAIQKLQERNDWTLSEGQNYQLKDGVLVEGTNPDNSSKGTKQTGRTEQLSQA